MSGERRIALFLAFSSEMTAFTVFDLRGTGQTESYLAAVDDAVGPAVLDQLLAAHADILPAVGGDRAARDAALRRTILGDEKLGPVARNVMKLWYIGIWYELPRAWTEAFGARSGNVSFTVSASAYVEGLLWPAIGAHPPGAKAPGYASWTEAPLIPPIPSG